jgi:hypothetical protein
LVTKPNPAKWKRPNLELTVLLPFLGKINTYFPCNLKIDVKDFAFFTDTMAE